MRAGDRLIGAAKEAADRAIKDLDACMLQSMATALRHNLQFSFNSEDMADLLERMAVLRVTDPPTAETRSAAPAPRNADR